MMTDETTKKNRLLLPEARAFQAHFKAILLKKGISQADVARLSGITEPMVSHFISGSRRPDFSTLLKLAKGLEISLDELTGIDREKKD